jgi:hypothetical protein
MTAQISENLIYLGSKMLMCSEPLGQYFKTLDVQPKFEEICTALWRGYIGTWEIIDDQLYLKGLEGVLVNTRKLSTKTFFPDASEKVFAHWYSGQLRVPQGKLLEYVHMGYGSVYESDLLIDVEKGVVTKTTIRHNGSSVYSEEESKTSGGYKVMGFTLFGHNEKCDEY